MEEILAEILASTLFLLRSLVFWTWIGLGIAFGYILAIAISRLRLRSGALPIDAAYSGAILGFWISAILVLVLTWFLWRPDYVLIIFVLVLVVLVPWLVLTLVKRNEPLAES